MAIDVLLSTYNGEEFLEQLLQSLKEQSYCDWKLIVRDDGSTDKTFEILSGFSRKEPERVTIIRDNRKNMGPKRSFETLLQSSDSDYVMFCDQDDYWLPEKIKDTLFGMKKLEQQYPGIPAMIFSDLTVADRMLREVHTSFWKFIKVDPDNIFNTYRLLVNNPVVGCTVMINRNAKDIVLPFPEQAVMHDWWIALNISRKGVANYLSKPTVLYRLHEKNSIGASNANWEYYAGRLLNFSKTWKQNRNAIRMLRKLNFRLSFSKYMGYKIAITLSKLF